MLRSFVTLARSLNMTNTVSELGISRQTVRRHINELEAIRRVTLFDFTDRKYSLTPDGKQALFEAEVLLQKANNWIADNSNLVNGLPSINLQMSDGTPFHAQRHPLNAIWLMAPPLLKRGLTDFINAESLVTLSVCFLEPNLGKAEPNCRR